MFTACEVAEMVTEWEVARETFSAWEVAEMFTGNRTALNSISILEQPANGLMPQMIGQQRITQIIEFQVTRFFL